MVAEFCNNKCKKVLGAVVRWGEVVPVPLYQAKAELFRTLGHPVRIRVLELLQDGPMAVSVLLAELDIEPSTLSQQLAVLRRAGIVISTRQGTSVTYELAASDVADLMKAARRLLTEVLSGQGELLAELTDSPAVSGRGRR
jgi:ArsR family transcriptional regulator